MPTNSKGTEKPNEKCEEARTAIFRYTMGECLNIPFPPYKLPELQWLQFKIHQQMNVGSKSVNFYNKTCGL